MTIFSRTHLGEIKGVISDPQYFHECASAAAVNNSTDSIFVRQEVEFRVNHREKTCSRLSAPQSVKVSYLPPEMPAAMSSTKTPTSSLSGSSHPHRLTL